MKLRYIFLILLFTSIQFISAQDEDNRTAVGLYFTKAEYRGDLGNALWNFNNVFNYGGSVSLQQYLTPTFDIGIQGSYGRYNFKSNTGSFYGKKYDGFAYLNFKLNNGFIFNEKSVISPFLSGGLGFAGYNSGIPNPKGLDFIMPFGAGIKVQLTENIGLEFKYLISFTNNDSRDGVVAAAGRNDVFGQHYAGLIISFGGVDSDKDGVKDGKDFCPNTPLGIIVDKKGCPLDTDNDGVPDYLDECPNVSGSKIFNGCPDADNDGVSDNKDECPNTPEGVKVNRSGCPKDYDNDGVPDYLDKCPNVPGLVKFNGCPDSDNDRIPDNLDKCPTTSGLVQFDGCPDSDNDGIPDNEDKCPTVAGSKSNNGCPEVTEETKAIFTQALHDVQFATNKDILTKKSYSILNMVVKVMNENPAYKLEIVGYTDNQGDEKFNQTLSEKRAFAVMTYLTSAGIAPQRLSARGMGELNPIADNNTAEGRELNRRVEMKVTF